MFSTSLTSTDLLFMLDGAWVTLQLTFWAILLAVAVLAMGLWPAPLLDVMRPTIEQLVQQMMVTKV